MNLKKEILEELRSIFLNKTFDALLPPIIYALSNSFFNLITAVLLASTTAFFVFLKRIIKKKTGNMLWEDCLQFYLLLRWPF